MLKCFLSKRWFQCVLVLCLVITPAANAQVVGAERTIVYEVHDNVNYYFGPYYHKITNQFLGLIYMGYTNIGYTAVKYFRTDEDIDARDIVFKGDDVYLLAAHNGEVEVGCPAILGSGLGTLQEPLHDSGFLAKLTSGRLEWTGDLTANADLQMHNLVSFNFIRAIFQLSFEPDLENIPVPGSDITGTYQDSKLIAGWVAVALSLSSLVDPGDEGDLRPDRNIVIPTPTGSLSFPAY